MGDFDRVRWRCRRGLLELDLILARFLDRHYAGLDAGQRQAFDRLLEAPDNDLLDLAMGRVEADSEVEGMLVNLLRNS
jgi:antitoxin CptB